ncbi:hypothetical protein BKA58DRAFT_391384 [Alternaria rosae]|uniref:uncharacterized protein n=1 Tax=Alternaria rosae TaxID=1187941 RepID=UPI001E8CE418|nr:uncharacterized protein BKA58DRAFT_391384 [Alternaria rosae]KAH6865095.1 hypothetical protein BKA58DRAFT_391384 [Alternaria rosae]
MESWNVLPIADRLIALSAVCTAGPLSAGGPNIPCYTRGPLFVNPIGEVSIQNEGCKQYHHTARLFIWRRSTKRQLIAFKMRLQVARRFQTVPFPSAGDCPFDRLSLARDQTSWDVDLAFDLLGLEDGLGSSTFTCIYANLLLNCLTGHD